MLDFVGKRYWYFLLSALIIVPGVISLLIPPALKLGIEFTSGTTITVAFQREVDQGQLRAKMAALGHPDAIIQHGGSSTFLMRTRTLKTEKKDAAGNVVEASERQALEEALRAEFGNMEVLDFASVSPIVAGEILRNAVLAVVAASVGILLYISWAFRRLNQPLRYGTCAVVALLHDALVILGLFSIFGKLFGMEVGSMFITAVLTVIGYSVHDTIVVFDRIRENLGKGLRLSFETIVNRSILETLGRSINTTLTLLFTLSALYLFGGVTIRTFILVLLIGVVSGAYSSIFNASQLLVVWENGEVGRLAQRVQRRFAPTVSR